ncbi:MULTISPECIES: hypothetical protein [Paenibacillus]|uniref:hypothetical protein n=1 Tax=Paenibacillus TaxID=44249 RepID=UPI0022B8B418|nr:hypothetical protein [Paenibacillus caseinilyticus]MCZ8518395.1 hypothetical protein [Paenibacillus caseinilyticus]
MGNVAPYGYLRKKLPGKGCTLEPHPEQAQIVQIIFSLHTDPNPDTRLGTARITRYLNEELRIPTLKNSKCGWIVAAINGILRNPKNPDSLICTTHNCKNVSSYFHKVEEKLLQALKIILFGMKQAAEIQALPNESEAEKRNLQLKLLKDQVKVLEKTKNELNLQKGNLHDLVETGTPKRATPCQLPKGDHSYYGTCAECLFCGRDTCRKKCIIEIHH